MSLMRVSLAVFGLATALAALPCSAQQYRYTRNLDLVRRTADNRALQNVYWVTLPLVPIVADAADTGSPLSNKCVGDVDGPPAGDGVINADDLICAWWTARSDRNAAGAFTLYRVVTNRCTQDFRSASVIMGTPRFLGTPFDLEEGIGYQVLVTVPTGSTASPRNSAVITGDYDRAYPGRTLTPTPDCGPGQVTNCCAPAATRLDLVSTPPDTLYRTAYEILCGLAGVDWMDGNGDGRPDTCWSDANANGRWDTGELTTGIFDGRVAASVSYFDNSEAINAPSSCTATIQLGGLRFTGTNYPLRPGDAYLITLSKTHTTTVYLPPVP